MIEDTSSDCAPRPASKMPSALRSPLRSAVLQLRSAGQVALGRWLDGLSVERAQIDLAVYRLRDGGPVAAAAIALGLSAGCEFRARAHARVAFRESWADFRGP